MMDAKYIQQLYCTRTNADGRDFFVSLRDAILEEYRKSGKCEYIDELLVNENNRISVIEFAVFRAVQDFFSGNRMLLDVDRVNHIPYLNENMIHPWEVWQRLGYIGSRTYMYWEAKKCLMKIRDAGREASEPFIKRVTEKVKGIGKSYSNMESEDSLAKANEILAKAQKEAENIKAQAHAEASRERERIIDEARQKYTQIVNEAHMKAEEICAEAEQKKPAWDEEAAKERLGKHFEEYQNQMHAAQISWEKDFLKSEQETAEKADRIHREMCEMTNAVQAEWGIRLNKTIEGLRAIESDFFTKLHAWQTALYPRDLRRIAESYIELYRAINIEKIIQAEAVFQMSQDREKPSEATIEALEKLESKLRTHLKRYGNALNGLGMYVLFPQEGEAYDDVLHSCSEEPEEPAVITKCITPAIIRKMEGDGNDDVVKKAVVEIKITGKDAMSYEYHNV